MKFEIWYQDLKIMSVMTECLPWGNLMKPWPVGYSLSSVYWETEGTCIQSWLQSASTGGQGNKHH